MCKCHKKSVYEINFSIDEDSLSQGWDGDVPLDPSREWTAYNIDVMRICTRCEASEIYLSLGSCWASDDGEGREYLIDLIESHGMLPRGVNIEDCEKIYGTREFFAAANR